MLQEQDSALAAKVWAGEYLGADGALVRDPAEFKATRELAAHWRRLGNDRAVNLAALYLPDECILIANALLTRYRAWWASGTYAIATERFAKSAFECTKSVKGAHTPALAALTLARVKLLHVSHTHRHAARHRAEAAGLLAEAQSRAALVNDANQKSCILRGIAEVTVGIGGHTHDALLAARAALDAADAIPGIPPDVRAKNEAMRKRIGF